MKMTEAALSSSSASFVQDLTLSNVGRHHMHRVMCADSLRCLLVQMEYSFGSLGEVRLSIR
jgi:hypothetical protein